MLLLKQRWLILRTLKSDDRNEAWRWRSGPGCAAYLRMARSRRQVQRDGGRAHAPARGARGTDAHRGGSPIVAQRLLAEQVPILTLPSGCWTGLR